jgi:signal transduction histidine kinase
VAGVIGVSRDITSLRRAEQAQRFLAQVGMAISASLDVQAILEVVARLPVPELADYCIVRLFDERGRPRATAYAHARLEKEPQLAAFAAHDPGWLADGGSPVARAMRAGQPQISPTLSPAIAEEWSSPEARSLLAGLAPCSRLLVPLPSRRGPLGVLALLFADSGRHYGEADLALAEALAQRASLAIDNALLYAEAQTLNQALEARVLERTAELELSQAQLRQLSARLEALREEERARLAREVHDELGGFLTAIKMDIVRLGRAGGDAAVQAERLDRLQHSIDETVQTVRRIATELRPALLDDFGLVAAMEWQLGEFARRSGLRCELRAPTDGVALAGDGATAVFRVFQETLTNIARHAEASAVDVTLQAGDGRLTLEVRDNGIGIDAERLQSARSLGLLGMRERIRLLSGELDIRGQAGAGTVVRVTIPM